MSCCRSNSSAGKILFLVPLLILGVLILFALPDLQRYLRIRNM
jgi:hypothetical protein